MRGLRSLFKAAYLISLVSCSHKVVQVDCRLTDSKVCDDSAKCASIIELIGFLTIIVMDFLKKRNVLSPDSDIPNLGFTFASMIQWAWSLTTDFSNWRSNATWIYRVIHLA
jgi:hypothetical protein